ICGDCVRLLDSIAHHFAGRILLRGLGRDNSGSYTKHIESEGGQRLTSRLQTVRDRFWLAAGFPQIPGYEGDLLRRRSVVLPVGLPKSLFKHRDENTGSDARVFFVCPSIEEGPESGVRVSMDVKGHFGALVSVNARR